MNLLKKDGVETRGDRLNMFSEGVRGMERGIIDPAGPRRLVGPIAPWVEVVVPQDHCFRHLEHQIDLSLLQDWMPEIDAKC